MRALYYGIGIGLLLAAIIEILIGSENSAELVIAGGIFLLLGQGARKAPRVVHVDPMPRPEIRLERPVRGAGDASN